MIHQGNAGGILATDPKDGWINFIIIPSPRLFGIRAPKLTFKVDIAHVPRFKQKLKGTRVHLGIQLGVGVEIF